MDISDVYRPTIAVKITEKRTRELICYEIYGRDKTKLLRRQACKTKNSQERGNTVFGLHTDEDTIEKEVRCLTERNSIRATARIMDNDEDTQSAVSLIGQTPIGKRVLDNLLKDIYMDGCQLNAFWGFVKRTSIL